MAIEVNRKRLQKLELEDYIAIKQYAYDFFVKNYPEGQEFNLISNYIGNILDYQLTDKEAIIFKATALLPYDRDICEVYNYGEEMYEKMKRVNYIYGESFDIKKLEIELFHLDRLIEDGVLVPPIFSNYQVEEKDKNI